jgi:acetyl/propionyl-CoA carboxylase alpha subunit
MIGKIISHALVREDAIDKLISFLEKISIDGIKTNIPFLISLLKDKRFLNGTHNTKYIENNLNALISTTPKFNQTPKNIDLNPGRIKIVETDKLKVAHGSKKTSEGGIKVVYFD